jgi:SAM-dependent methyltransferase
LPSLRSLFERVAYRALSPLGYELRDKILNEKPEGFPGYLADANAAGMDVNDYEEKVLGWKPAQDLIDLTTVKYLKPDSVVVDLGPGTGRLTRPMLPHLPTGRVLMVDHSPWMVRFLKGYFAGEPRVEVYLNDGRSLPMPGRDIVDVMFVAGTFVALKLGQIYLYLREFARVVKPGGHVIIDYIDADSELGWQHLKRNADELGYVYTYHAGSVLDRLFDEEGFDVVERIPVEKSTYVVLRKR